MHVNTFINYFIFSLFQGKYFKEKNIFRITNHLLNILRNSALVV